MHRVQNSCSKQDDHTIIKRLMVNARQAMASLYSASQDRVDEAVTALCWAIYKPENAKETAELAVSGTGLGNVKDKIIKNQRKNFGTLRDLLRVKTVGVIEKIPEKDCQLLSLSVLGAVVPSTNPPALRSIKQ